MITRAIQLNDEPSLVFDNPYLRKVQALGIDVEEPEDKWPSDGSWRALEHRFNTVKEFAFAIPNAAAIAAIAKFGPVLEIGAGSGYWAWCLRQVGCDVIAVDNGSWKFTASYTEVTTACGIESAADYPDRTLLSVWPYMDQMAAAALTRYQGKHFAYVGEGEGGCTGTDEMFAHLANWWTVVADIWIPQWPGIRDQLTIYERK